MSRRVKRTVKRYEKSLKLLRSFSKRILLKTTVQCGTSAKLRSPDESF